MFHPTRRHRAESLIETLTAITVIVIATAAALSVVRMSLRGNDIIGDKVVALNLALEGIEAVRNIRDTNYLRFASNPDDCWDALSVDDVDDCPSTEHLNGDSAYYVLERDLDPGTMFKWTLVGTDLTTEGQISLYSLDLDGDSEVDLKLYAQAGLSSGSDYSVLSETSGQYQRLLEVSSADSDYIYLKSTVYWEDGEREVSVTRAIANVQ